MAIVLAKPVSFTKGTDHVIRISKAAVRAIPKVLEDQYFSDSSRWSSIVFNFNSDIFNEIEVVKFAANVDEPEAIFSVSVRALNGFHLGSIVIHDHDGGELTVHRDDLPEDDTSLEFNVEFPVEQLVNPTLTATIGNEQINLSWAPISTLPDYQIWKKTGNGQFVKIIPNHASNSYVDTDVVGNQTYGYYVVLDFDEDLYTSNVAVVTTTSPVTPTLTKTSMSSSQAQLSWTSSAGAVEYRLYKKINSGNYGAPVVLPSTQTTFSEAITPGTVYTYKVTAYSGFSSGPSNEVISAPIGTITQTVEALVDAEVRVTRNTVPGATTYKLFYKVTSDPTYTQLTDPTNPHVARYVGLTQYSFYMRAENSYGYFSETAVQNVTTTAEPPPEWNSRASLSSWNNDVVFGGGVYVMVGASSRVLRSVDGMTWSEVPCPLGSWETVAYGNGRFVVTSQGAGNYSYGYAFSKRTMYSTDNGLTWQLGGDIPADISIGNYSSLAYGNGLFVLGGEIYKVGLSEFGALTSPDGAVWTFRQFPSPAAFYDMIFENGMFVGAGSGAILTSPDGITWTKNNSGTVPNTSLYSITYGNGVWVFPVIGGFYYSTDNTATWTLANTLVSNRKRVSYGNNKFIALGNDNIIWSSTDGNIWTQSNKTGTGTISAMENSRLEFGNGLWVIAGYASNGLISTSTDGINWTDRDSHTYNLTGHAYGNGVHVAIGQKNSYLGASAISADNGVSWRLNPVPSGMWRDIAFGNGRFVAVGAYIGGANNYNNVMTSTDGINWTAVADTNLRAENITFGNGRFVICLTSFSFAVGKPFAYSTDGINWTIPTTSLTDSTSFTNIGYWDNQFVAVKASSQNSVVTSPDGATWTARPLNSSVLLAAGFINGKLIVGSHNTANPSSANGYGINYLSTNSGTAFSSQYIYPALGPFASGLNRLIGIEKNPSYGAWSSTDGSTWTKIDPGTPQLVKVSFANGKFIIVGANGYIATYG